MFFGGIQLGLDAGDLGHGLQEGFVPVSQGARRGNWGQRRVAQPGERSGPPEAVIRARMTHVGPEILGIIALLLTDITGEIMPRLGKTLSLLDEIFSLIKIKEMF